MKKSQRIVVSPSDDIDETNSNDRRADGVDDAHDELCPSAMGETKPRAMMTKGVGEEQQILAALSMVVGSSSQAVTTNERDLEAGRDGVSIVLANNEKGQGSEVLQSSSSLGAQEDGNNNDMRTTGHRCKEQRHSQRQRHGMKLEQRQQLVSSTRTDAANRGCSSPSGETSGPNKPSLATEKLVPHRYGVTTDPVGGNKEEQGQELADSFVADGGGGGDGGVVRMEQQPEHHGLSPPPVMLRSTAESSAQVSHENHNDDSPPTSSNNSQQRSTSGGGSVPARPLTWSQRLRLPSHATTAAARRLSQQNAWGNLALLPQISLAVAITNRTGMHFSAFPPSLTIAHHATSHVF